MIDPLAGTPWSRPETVAGFVNSPPNIDLLDFAWRELGRTPGRVALDLGCGAGRNAVPLAQQGWMVVAIDMSLPMLDALKRRVHDERLTARLRPLLAPMDCLPIRGRSCDLLIAHGIWNLARSGAEFRAAVREAARGAAPGAALFVFTFSRNTLPASTQPIAGESFVFTEFSGSPQCFLTEEQLLTELASAGFDPEAGLPVQELNRRQPGTVATGGPPVIYQGAFRYRG
jgi:ubiquinone/menaquinone biosynthesis C-methylase UbiE